MRNIKEYILNTLVVVFWFATIALGVLAWLAVFSVISTAVIAWFAGIYILYVIILLFVL